MTFNVRDMPHALVSTILDNEFGIATRNGCFCAHPYLVHLLGIEDGMDALRQRVRDGATTHEPDFPGAARATIGIYNTREEVDRFVEALDIIASGDHSGDYVWSEAAGWQCRGCRTVNVPPETLWVS